MNELELERLYQLRFSEVGRRRKDAIWQVLCGSFFQRWIPEDARVLEIACGLGEFIRGIRAKEKLAVDLNPESRRLLGPEVKFFQLPATDLSAIPSSSVDVVFSSNFFEHLKSKEELTLVLREAFRVLRPGGRYLSLQPNLKYVKEAYWDFYDHQLPLTHVSAVEGFEHVGFEIETLYDRFLPYTTKSRLPQAPWLVWAYLHFPLAWKLLGKQFFLVARRPS